MPAKFDRAVSNQELYSLTDTRAADRNSDPLDLGLTADAFHLENEIILAGEILGRPVNRDEGWDLYAKALLEIGCA